VIQCAERQKLVSAWVDSANQLAELQEKKLAALKSGQVDFNRFDTKIRKAEEAEATAEQLYREHLDQHGCG
jgi:hypothetical protein